MFLAFLLFHVQLGLAEKNILSYDFDLIISDPSDHNTNSTTLFSDDTDDKSRKSVNLEVCPSIQFEDEVIFHGSPNFHNISIKNHHCAFIFPLYSSDCFVCISDLFFCKSVILR